jgi:TetR/AcrR family transcriptional regulator
MGNPARKRDEKEGSRGRILDGATEEFAAAGFAGARIDRIARRTKLNVRMIYYHFGSKKGLYRAVLQGIYEQAVRILDETERLEEPTMAALGMYFDLLVEHPLFANVLVRELLDGAKHLKALFKERPDLFKRVHLRAREIIDSGIQQGLLQSDDVSLTVMSITSIVCFLTATREARPLFLDGRVPDNAEYKAHLVGLLYEGLRKR